MIRKSIRGGMFAVMPGAGSLGDIASSDVGKLVVESSGKGVLLSSTSTSAPAILGMIACVPNETSGGSTVPFYIHLVDGLEIEQTFSTVASVTLPATSDIGDFVGWSTLADVGIIGMDTKSSSATNEAFLKITGFDNDRRKVFGVVNSSNLVL
jgi:hypothetical protein